MCAAAVGSEKDPRPVLAFDNAAQSVKVPKQPGVPPRDLGLKARSLDDASATEVVGLKGCRTTANCFSTTFDDLVDRGTRAIDPWHFSAKTPAAAMNDILAAVYSYIPGQQGIDGGGFDVKNADLRYTYVQFESLKKGYIDDVEFAIAPGTDAQALEGSVLVRSSSRTGKSDYGVNAIRLNYIADFLRRRGGWTVRPIDGESHPGYWKLANCRTESVRDRFPAFCS